MARCPNCGSECSKDIPRCPGCGNKIFVFGSVRNDKPVSKLVWVLLILILIPGVYFHFTAPDKPVSTSITQKTDQVKKIEKRNIAFSAVVNQREITIYNKSDFDWTNTEVTVANGITDSYSLRVGTVKAGSARTCLLSNFVNDLSGKRYNGYQYSPRYVFIDADNASGEIAY